jgi:hypothetical protein
MAAGVSRRITKRTEKITTPSYKTKLNVYLIGVYQYLTLQSFYVND